MPFTVPLSGEIVLIFTPGNTGHKVYDISTLLSLIHIYQVNRETVSRCCNAPIRHSTYSKCRCHRTACVLLPVGYSARLVSGSVLWLSLIHILILVLLNVRNRDNRKHVVDSSSVNVKSWRAALSLSLIHILPCWQRCCLR